MLQATLQNKVDSVNIGTELRCILQTYLIHLPEMFDNYNTFCITI